MALDNCETCGQFHACGLGSAWMTVYSGAPWYEPERDITRCVRCVERVGPFHPQHGIKPEHNCGIVKESPRDGDR